MKKEQALQKELKQLRSQGFCHKQRGRGVQSVEIRLKKVFEAVIYLQTRLDWGDIILNALCLPEFEHCTEVLSQASEVLYCNEFKMGRGNSTIKCTDKKPLVPVEFIEDFDDFQKVRKRANRNDFGRMIDIDVIKLKRDPIAQAIKD